MLKKILKGIGIFLLVVIIALAAAPFLFKDKIQQLVLKSINEKVDAKVAFDDVHLSLFKSFPRANVTIDKLAIINKAPFEGDTLLYAGEVNLKMSVRELFKGDGEPMNIESFSSTNGVVNILFDKNGVGNFDIAIKDDKEKKDDSESKPFAMNIQNYEIENLRFTYFDERSKVKMVIDSLNHTGKGNFAASKLDLTTKTTAKVSLDMDKTNYMKNVKLDLDAVLGIDLENSKYTFKDNKALINQLPLEFDGFIQIVDAGQEYDLTFKTPTSSFKNFLGVIPEAYAGNLNTVKTTGDFKVSGFAKGLYSDKTIPKFNLAITSNNASFKYPDLPKSVENIVIDTKIINETGNLNDTYVNLDKLSFRIDQDVFNVQANVKNIVENPLVDAKLKGTINLGNVSKAYPVKLDTPLSGILKADVETKFDMKSVEANQYQNIQAMGNASITGFKYVDADKKTYTINTAAAQFSNQKINLQQLDMTTGKTDLKVNGTLENFLGYAFKNQELRGNFTMKSNQFLVSDFMSKTETTVNNKTVTTEAVKIPKLLNVTLNASANTVVYDNLNLKDVSGKIVVKDEAVSLQNLKTSIFNGLITATGDVSTKGKVPTFDMNLGLTTVDINQTFTQLDMMKKIAPIAEAINGKLNSTIKLSGNLDAKTMSPDLNTLSGDLFGQLLSTTVNAKNSAVLNKLDEKVKFIDLQKLNLNDLKANLTFKDGKVNVKPFDIKYQDIKINVGGQHGFDQSMNYNLKFDVPAKYLGNDANKLIAKLTPAEANKLENIPVTAILTGNFKNPKVSTDIEQAVTKLANQLVKAEKDKLVTKGTSALENLLGGNKKDTTKTQTSTPKEDVKTKVSEGIKGLFNKKKKE
ncbi:MAG: AsmA-like C-terminal region-containing protein [Flavobacterium lindanitolerans]|uniref:AsmA-like C-terminal region-containing protein n=1 Tax=Flavobacterium lindanitolerans TaxID=428988 RepID=UPI001A428CBE|nr:AsmA-like C-terminal region-containing protein [Flavobacterium lindanitolerans]MBL7867015.1 AsmA-like C-terminal region-containing protein [Flavobacterium lindanitolerans]